MNKVLKIFLAFLLSITMIFTMGISTFTETQSPSLEIIEKKLIKEDQEKTVIEDVYEEKTVPEEPETPIIDEEIKEKTVTEDVYEKKLGSPSIKVEVTTDKELYENGDTLIYNIVLVNDGEVDLKDISIVDDLNGQYQLDSLLTGEEKRITKEYSISLDNSLEEIKNNIYITTIFNEEEVLIETGFTILINKEKEDELAENIPSIVGEPKIPIPDFYKRGMQKTLLSTMSSGLIDTIGVDKSAIRVPGCRTFEVTLDITGEPQEAPVDVVLVIDRSGSMNERAGGTWRDPLSRLYFAKEAAINFAGRVLGPNGIPGSRVSVVSFSGPQYQSGYGNQNQASTNLGLSSDLYLVADTINNITANGGTNTEAGFIEAKGVIQGSGNQNSNKVVIMFTDGIPTASNGNKYGPNDPTSHNNHTIAAYTAGQDIWQNGVADVFTIGLLQNINTNVKNLAIDTLTRAQNKGFYEAPTAQDLDQIFTEISTQLVYSATNAVVVDKIGDDFELVDGSLPSGASYNSSTREITWSPGTIGTHAQLKYIIRAKSSFPGGSANTNEYANLTYTDINGNSNQTKTFPVPQVNVPVPLSITLTDATITIGDSIDLGTGTNPNDENYMSPITGGDGNGTYTYEWRVVGDSDIVSTDKNPTVSPVDDTRYQLTVIDSNGCKTIATILVIVEDPKGSITITKVVENSKLEDISKEFDIFINGPNGAQYVVTLKNGESETIENLELGSYTVSEIVPMNYELVDISSSEITLSLDNLNDISTVTNKPDNDSWFYDDDERKNNFSIGVTTANNHKEENTNRKVTLLVEAIMPNKLKAIEEDVNT